MSRILELVSVIQGMSAARHKRRCNVEVEFEEEEDDDDDDSETAEVEEFVEGLGWDKDLIGVAPTRESCFDQEEEEEEDLRNLSVQEKRRKLVKGVAFA